jgi:hypothetical protein
MSVITQDYTRPSENYIPLTHAVTHAGRWPYAHTRRFGVFSGLGQRDLLTGRLIKQARMRGAVSSGVRESRPGVRYILHKSYKVILERDDIF